MCSSLSANCNFLPRIPSSRRWRDYKVRGHTPVGLRRSVHLSDLGRWAGRWMENWVCDAWPVWRQTYGYLPSCRASPPFGRYQIVLLGDRGAWVWTTCPELLLGSGLAGSRTRDLSITSQRPNHWATKPPMWPLIFTIVHETTTFTTV